MPLLTNYYIDLLLDFFKLYGIKKSREFAHLMLCSSEYYPSLLSIVETLYVGGLESMAVKGDETIFSSIDKPCIAQIEDNGSFIFVIIEIVGSQKFRVYNAKQRLRKEYTLDEVLKVWTGILVIPNLSPNNHTIKQPIKSRKPSSIFYLIFITSLISICLVPKTLVLYYFLSIIGLLLVTSLLKRTGGKLIDDFLFPGICKKGKYIDCEKISKSRFAKVFGISLSEIVFVYFLFRIVLLCIIPDEMSGKTLSFLSLLSAIALMFSILSILYQVLVVNKYCLFCIGISLIVIFENYINISVIKNIFRGILTFPSVQFIIVSVLLSSFFLLLFKRYLTLKKENIENKIESMKIKRNTKIINEVMIPVSDDSFLKVQDLTIGNPKASSVVTTLISPFCSKCEHIVSTMVDFMRKHPDSILWNIRLDGIEEINMSQMNFPQYELYSKIKETQSFEEKLLAISEWKRVKSITSPANLLLWNQYQSHVKLNKVINTNKVPAVWVNNRELSSLVGIDIISTLIFKQIIGALYLD